MRPNDVIQPTKLCRGIISRFKPWHRGTVLEYPDRHNCVMVQWDHKKKPEMMAGRYVEAALVEPNLLEVAA